MNTSDLLKLIKNQLEQISQQNLDYSVYTLHEYTLKKLYLLINNSTCNGKDELYARHDYIQLRNFLKEFHEIVKDTDFLPLHAPTSGLSQVMLQLAQHLEDFFIGSNRFQLLMPTITVNNYIMSGTSLSDPDLNLNDFVMSDDNTCVIEVLNCLKFAMNDGILKHTCLFGNEIKELSDAEQYRVINHSKETQELWQAIQTKIEITIESDSFGAVLYRLAQDLDLGGIEANRGATEYNSGADANVGILNFFIWFDELTLEEQKYLESKQASHEDLREVFERLRRPTDANFLSSIYCVSLISDIIQDILEACQELYDQHPQQNSDMDMNELRINLALEAITNAEYRLINQLAGPKYKVTATYLGSNNRRQLANKLLKLEDLENYVSLDSIERLRNSIVKKRGPSTKTSALHTTDDGEIRGRPRPRISNS